MEMVHLVLEAPRQKALALDHDGLAQPVNAPHRGILGPPDRVPQLREGKASFLVFLLAIDGLDHGVDQVPDPAIDLVGKDAAAHPDLVGRQARTSRRGNGLFQISHQAGERLIEPVDGVAGGAEHWIAEQADGTLGHRAILP